jgi:hypothetical protein
VGINDYPYDGSDLNGCVNDAMAWADVMVQHYDFPRTDVKVITDSDATKANMLAGIKELLTGAKAGDVLVFTNSSHGSYKAEVGGDEPTYDEVICPYDTSDNVLIDDELRELFSGLPKGVRLTVISDSCFSGTVTRVVPAENFPGLVDLAPDDRRVRFLNPALRGDPVLANPYKARPKRYVKYPESRMKEVLLSGCTDSEYSYDARIGGVYHGAMTYHALQAIREANHQITYSQLRTRLNYLLREAGYPQHPQLEGNWENKRRPIFT